MRIHTRLGLPARSVHLVLQVVSSSSELNDAVSLRTGLGIDEWAVGVALPFEDWLGIRHDPNLAYDLSLLRRVVDHELVHLALGGVGPEAYRRLPRWFHEGVAQWCTEEAYYGDVMDLYVASRFDQLLPFRDLQESFPRDSGGAALAYQQSLSFVRYLTEVSPLPFVPRVLRRVAAGGSFEQALVETTGRSRIELESSWQERVRNDSTLLLRFLRENFFFVILLLLSPLVLFALVRQARRRQRLRDLWDAERRETRGLEDPHGDNG